MEEPKAKKVKKEEKKARKRAKKDAKREAKRARKESKKSGGSSSSSSDDEGDATLRQLAVEAARGGPVPLPAAARWQGPALEPVASIASLEAQLAAARSARVARAAAGPAVGFGSSQIMPLRQSQAEVEMRGLRAARFEQTAAEKALAAAASRPVPKLPAGQVLQGKSQALEKSYLRLTSMPRADQAPPRTAPHAYRAERTAPHTPHTPHTAHRTLRTAHAAPLRAAALLGRRPTPPLAGGWQVRPLPVLREAFAMVGQRWKKVRFSYHGYSYDACPYYGYGGAAVGEGVRHTMSMLLLATCCGYTRCGSACYGYTYYGHA